MAIKMERPRGTYTLTDIENGYSYTIRTARDEYEEAGDTGWYASISFKTFGLATEEAAIERLGKAAERFLQMLREKE